MSKRVVIIAALEREVAPFVKGWRRGAVRIQQREIPIFESGDSIVACGGIGGNAARAAADALYQHAQREVALFISAGYAGALTPAHKVGDVFQPRHIVCSTDFTRAETYFGEGVLVSAGTVASSQHKRELAQQHSAHAVDMEAYSVADVARVYGVPCIAIKVISDEHDFPLPPMGRFVDQHGRFQAGSFAVYAAMRPWLWRRVIQLGRDSARAAVVLADALRSAIDAYSRAPQYNKEEAISRK